MQSVDDMNDVHMMTLGLGRKGGAHKFYKQKFYKSVKIGEIPVAKQMCSKHKTRHSRVFHDSYRSAGSTHACKVSVTYKKPRFLNDISRIVGALGMTYHIFE